MKTPFTVGLLLLLVLVTQAQSNFQPGMVVTRSGDTLQGFIDHKEWSRNPKSFLFKNEATDKTPVEFTAQWVRYFEVEDEKYVRYIGHVTMDANSLKSADVYTVQFASDTIFLKIVTSGRYLTLTHYRDKVKNRYFLTVGKSAPEELIYRMYPDDGGDASRFVIDDRYKSQLIAAAQQTKRFKDEVKWAIKKSTYGTKSLAHIVDMINEDPLNTENIPARKKAPPLHWFAGGGLNVCNLRISDSYVADVNTTASHRPYFTGGFDVMGNPQVGKLVFRAELSVAFATLKAVSNDGLSETHYSARQVTTSITPQLIYNIYNTRKCKIYVSPGLRFNVSSYSNDEFGFDIVPVWVSFKASAGVVLNQRFEIQVSYIPQLGQMVSNFEFWATAVNYSQVGVGYHFGKR